MIPFHNPRFSNNKVLFKPTQINRKLDHGYWGLGQGRQGMFFSFLCSNKSLFKEHLKGWRDYIFLFIGHKVSVWNNKNS